MEQPPTALQLDTSPPGLHTIEYRAYDQNGLMGSATRAVVVNAPANDNLPLPLLVATGTKATSSTQ
jgi:hypothetical protein